MKVVVAYSGGLDTSVIVKWVKETYNAGVSWTETKESIKLALQAELDSVNSRLE